MAAKALSTYIGELSAITALGAGDKIPTLEGGVLKVADGSDFAGGGGGGITALTGDVTASGTGSVAATIAALAVTNAKVATGIDAVKIADGSITNTEFQYLNGVTSAIQTQLDAKQTLDATLTALAALTIAADSLTIGTAADTFSQTTFAANTFPGKSSTGNLVAKAITDFGLSLVDDADASTARTTLGLGNVENTALSTWAGTTNITTLGTIATGTWSGTEIPVTKGGTTLTALGAANQIIGVNSGASANEYKTISGTTNQITVTHGAGTITLSAPQNTHTAATPSFAGLIISNSPGSATVSLSGGTSASTLLSVGNGANSSILASFSSGTTDLGLTQLSTSSSSNASILRFIVNDGAAMASGDLLGTLCFQGYNTSVSTVQSGKVQAFSDGTFTASSNPTYLSFSTTPASSVTALERVRVNSSGETEFRAGSGMRVYDSDNTHYIAIVPPATGSLTANYTLTLPVDDGTASQLLTTDGAGGLSWTTPAGSSSWGGITGTLSSQTDLQTALDARQPLDATLTAFAALTIAASSLTIGTGADAFSQTTFAANTFPARASTGSLVAKTITDFGLSLVDDADASTARTTLGLGTLATQSGTFSGTSSGTNTGDQTTVSGNAGTVTVADAGGDTTTWVLLGTSQTGSLAPATDAGITYNATTNALTATTFVGALTGNADTVTGFSGTHSGTSSGTNTGDQTVSLSGDVTGSGTGSFTATIANSAVTLAKMADMATASILGRNTAGTGVPEVLSASTTKTLLSLNNVENTALSTWAGTTNITTLGTIATGTWSGTEIAATKGGTGLTALGTALQQLRVNAGATALEYFTPSAGSGDIINGGNTTGAEVTIGTNDAFALNLETTGVTRMAITGGASTGGAVTITNVTANTNTVSDGITIQTNSSGTAAASFGGGILFRGESSTTDSQDMVRLSAIWTTATHASRASALVYSDVTAAGALTERFRFTPTTMTLVAGSSYTIGNSSANVVIGGGSGQVGFSTSSSFGIVLTPTSSTTTGNKVDVGNSTNYNNTSGTRNLLDITGGFNPSSGTGIYAGINIGGTVNQTSTASGNVKGLTINPTLTAVLGSYYAIEIVPNSTSAKGIYQTGANTVNNFVGATGFGATTAPTDKVEITGNLALLTAGNKIKIATGTNASAGISGSMTAGSITISTTAVTASSIIMLTHSVVAGTVGVLSVGTITAATSFVINSSSASDTSTVNWWIIN